MCGWVRSGEGAAAAPWRRARVLRGSRGRKAIGIGVGLRWPSSGLPGERVRLYPRAPAGHSPRAGGRSRRGRSGRAPAPSPAASASQLDVAAHDRLVEARPSRAAPATARRPPARPRPRRGRGSVRTSHSGQRSRSVSPPPPRSRQASSWSSSDAHALQTGGTRSRTHQRICLLGRVSVHGVIPAWNATGGG